MSHDHFFRAAEAPGGFSFDTGRQGERHRCLEVRGFGDALLAAEDPRAPAPARLVLDGLDDDAARWIEGWAEDAEQVRRELVIHRADGAQVAVVATLAAHGHGVPTALAVESVRARPDAAILRSGVHLRVDVEAALARGDDDLQ